MFFVTSGSMEFPSGLVDCGVFIKSVKSELKHHKAANLYVEDHEITFTGNTCRAISSGNILNHIGKGYVCFAEEDKSLNVSFRLTHYMYQISNIFLLLLAFVVIVTAFIAGNTFCAPVFYCLTIFLICLPFWSVQSGKRKFRQLIKDAFIECVEMGNNCN